AVPLRQVETRLAPTKNPRYRAQILNCSLAGAPRGPGPDMAGLDGVHRRRLREELDETVSFNQFPVDIAAELRLRFERAVVRLRGGWRETLLHERPAGNAGQQALQVNRCRQAVGVFLGDHFSLFGDANFAMQRAGRERFEKHRRGTGAAADGSST